MKPPAPGPDGWRQTGLIRHGILLSLLMPILAGCRPADSDVRFDGPPRKGIEEATARWDDVVLKVQSAVAEGNLEEASAVLNRRLIGHPDEVDALLLAAQIAALRGKPVEAIAMAEAIDINDPRGGVQAGELVAQQAALSHRDDLAIKKLTALIEQHGEQPQWLHPLWSLLNRQGRRFEASRHAETLCSIGQATLEESLSLIRRAHFFPVSEDESSFLNPSRLSKSLSAFSRRDFVTAQQVLQSEYESSFSSPAAAALYGRILAESENYDEIPSWITRCSEAAKSEAHYWAAIGVWLGSKHRFEEAIGATLAAIERDSTDRVSYQRIGSWLNATDQRELGEQFWHRGIQISETEVLSGVDGNASTIVAGDNQRMRDLALQLLELGRPFESMQWTLHAIGHMDTAKRDEVFDQLRQLRANTQLSEILQEHYRIGLEPADYPFEQSFGELLAKSRSRRHSPVSSMAPVERVTPVLDEVASQLGLTFSVIPKAPNDLSSLKMHEALGSGIAVIDFDLDGWPDLYFGQAGGSPPSLDSSMSDALFRNAEGRFFDVTHQAGVSDFNYTLGVAAGDVNQDGFADLLVANLGANTMLINNGDGTFSSQTHRLGSQRGDRYESLVEKVGSEDYLEGLFTTAVAIADVNGDHLPDLYTANYVELEDLLIPANPDKNGVVFQKTPRGSYAESDQCYFQTEDGSFVRQDIAPSIAPPATSLGLVITDIDGEGGNEIFVGNDSRPNHLLSWTEGQGWSNRADVLGIANNPQGLATACMGIAVADFDWNGKIDFFITNFSGEPACMYLQDHAGLFLDQQFRLGLDALTRPYVGFGCKALDFGHDGWHDVVITNGHVDPVVEGEFEMLPQCLVRHGDRFEAVTPESNSDYWQIRHAGRTMAMLDYDRDGLLDLVVNHVASPVALFRNRTPSTGSYIQFELVGTQSERDAIGAKVIVTAEGVERMHLVTAGDGYFCSDEAVLEISVGDATQVSSVEVQWPSGREQKFVDKIELNRRYLIIEGEALIDRSP